MAWAPGQHSCCSSPLAGPSHNSTCWLHDWAGELTLRCVLLQGQAFRAGAHEDSMYVARWVHGARFFGAVDYGGLVLARRVQLAQLARNCRPGEAPAR